MTILHGTGLDLTLSVPMLSPPVGRAGSITGTTNP